MTDFKSHLPVQTHQDGATFVATSDFTVGVGGYYSTGGTLLTAGVTVNREWLVSNAVLESVVYAEDDAHTTADPGVFVLAVRQDTLGPLAGTDGDYIPFIVNASGELYVRDTDANTKLTSIQTAVETVASAVYEEDSAHSTADPGMFVLGVRDDGVSATGTVTVVDYTQLSGIVLTVNGTALTEGVEWTAATSNDATASSLASAIDALSGLSASPTTNVITITADPGAAGNSVTLATGDAVNLTISGATLTGGADDTVLTSDNYDYSPFAVDKYGRIKVLADFDTDFDYVYTEDSAHVSGHSGAYVLAVRADARPTNANTSADGDYASFFINNSGELYVHDTDALTKLTEIDTVLDTIKTDTGSIDTTLTGLSHLEDDAHSSGDAGVMALAVRNDAGGALAGTDGDYIPLTTDSSGNLRVTGSFTLANLEHAEDSVHTTGDIGLMPLGVRQDATTPLAADGDYIPFSMDRNGALRVTVIDPNVAASEVSDYQTTPNVLKKTGTTNHDYTVTVAKTLIIDRIYVSGSGRVKATVILDPAGSPATKFVGFNSTSNPNIHWAVEGKIEVAAGIVVRIKIDNLDDQDQDVYSTLLGDEV